MSRLDEALRRATRGSVFDRRGITLIRDADAAAREDVSIDHYPRERAAAPGEDAGAIFLPQSLAAEGCGRLPADLDDRGLAERYGRLKEALDEARVGRGLRTVMVTSAAADEGKTAVAIGLALCLRQSSARVLVIDADLQRPSVHDVLGIGNDVGLGECLQGKEVRLPLIEAAPRLWVLPAGQAGSVAVPALTSERMGTALDECASAFDWVLLDTPPVSLLPAPRLLAHGIGAVVFVIGGETPFAACETAMAQIGRGLILGTVLNGLEL